MFCDEHGTADYCPECYCAELQQQLQQEREDNARLRKAAEAYMKAEDSGMYVLGMRHNLKMVLAAKGEDDE